MCVDMERWVGACLLGEVEEMCGRLRGRRNGSGSRCGGRYGCGRILVCDRLNWCGVECVLLVSPLRVRFQTLWQVWMHVQCGRRYGLGRLVWACGWSGLLTYTCWALLNNPGPGSILQQPDLWVEFHTLHEQPPMGHKCLHNRCSTQSSCLL